MKEVLLIVAGFIVGVVFARYLAKKEIATPSSRNGGEGKVLLNPEQVRQKEANLLKIMEFLETHDQVTNDEVEQMLEVSNNTAERYLDELEKQGKLTQVGRTGRSVVYKRK